MRMFSFLFAVVIALALSGQTKALPPINNDDPNVSTTIDLIGKQNVPVAAPFTVPVDYSGVWLNSWIVVNVRKLDGTLVHWEIWQLQGVGVGRRNFTGMVPEAGQYIVESYVLFFDFGYSQVLVTAAP